MSRIFASVWSIAMVWWMYKQEKKLLFIFYTVVHKSVYECHPYNRPGTHIALKPLNQDENKLMIYVLLNIHEGNPWLMWEKNEKTKMLLMWKSGQNFVRNVQFFLCDWKEMSFAFKTFFGVRRHKCLNFEYWGKRDNSNAIRNLLMLMNW